MNYDEEVCPNISRSNHLILNDAVADKFNFGSFWANGFPILCEIQTKIVDILKMAFVVKIIATLYNIQI